MDYFEYQKAVFASDLSYKAKLVALAIASHYNWTEGAACWPSDALLSQETGLSISSVTRAKRELVAREFLDSKRRYDSTNQYVPLLPVTVPLLTQTTPSSHTEQSLCSERATNREENNELNQEENKEEELQPQAAPTAGKSFESSLKEEQVTFSQMIGPDGPLVSLNSYVPPSLTTDEEWTRDIDLVRSVEVAESLVETPKDELDLKMDEYEAAAKLYADYDPEYWKNAKVVARREYTAGVYVQRACAIAFGAVSA